MTESVPASIVAGLEQLGEELATWVQAHQDGTLATHEQGVLQAVRQALPGLLGAVVQASTRTPSAPTNSSGYIPRTQATQRLGRGRPPRWTVLARPATL
jgi:hypothetical protein